MSQLKSLKQSDRVDFLVTESHYFDHLKEIWQALPDYIKGSFYIPDKMLLYVNKHKIETKSITKKNKPSIIVVASYGDLKKARILAPGSKIIMTEHGAGQSYIDVNHPAYIGGLDRSGVIAVLLPGQTHIKKHQIAHPTIPAYPVGCAKLDKYLNDLETTNQKPDKKTIAFSFHWNCRVTQETRSLFQFYKSEIKRIAPDYKIIGHGHPNDWHKFKNFWDQLRIEPVQDFEEVIDRAWVYAVDNSSTLFEWAALDRPVVVLNASIYRRDIEHGMRFWEFADIGVNCDQPRDLGSALDLALDDPLKIQKRRRQIIDQIYSNQGQAIKTAAATIEKIALDWRS